MSDEEIIDKIRDNITDIEDEHRYLLCDSLEDIIKNNNKNYDIQLIVSGLLNLYKKQQKEIEELKETLKCTQNSWYEETKIINKIKVTIEVMNTFIVNAEKFDCDYIKQCRFAKYVLQSLLERSEDNEKQVKNQ